MGVPCVAFNCCVCVHFIQGSKGLKIWGIGSCKLPVCVDVSVNVILRLYMSDWQPVQDVACLSFSVFCDRLQHRAILSSISGYFLLSAPEELSRVTFYRQMSNIS